MSRKEIQFSGIIVGSLSRGSVDRFTIRITDNDSGSLIEAELTPDQYAQALCASTLITDIKCCVIDPENFGKREVRERRSVVYPFVGSNKDEQEKWLVDNCQEPGWIVDSYLRSQSSVITLKGETILNYSVFKYVEEDGQER